VAIDGAAPWRRVPDWAVASTQMFAVQPLSQPLSGVVVHRPITTADCAEAKVIAPASEFPIQRPYHFFHCLMVVLPAGHFADFLTDALHPFG